jgi:opacity protein-like surface antigen
MKKFSKSVLLMIFILCGGVLFAQDNWSIEFRPGINFPTAQVDNIDVKTGFGFEATVAYQFIPNLAAYAGWGWNNFMTDGSLTSPASITEFEETGYTFGLQYVHPISHSALSYLLRAGAIYNHIEVENSEGDIVGDSSHGFGWQVAGGLHIDLGRRWGLLPELRYRSLSRDLNVGTTATDFNLNYVSIGVGISKAF